MIRALSEVVKLPNGLIGNVYESLKDNYIKSDNRQLKEEKEKATQMFVSSSFEPLWEKAFIDSEQHPFFKGSIGFFFEASITSPTEFTARYKTLKDLFDKDGISFPCKKANRHILIRALLANLKILNDLKGQRITKRSTEKFLKNTIVSIPALKNMFCGFFNQKLIINIENYLVDFIKKPFQVEEKKKKQPDCSPD